MLNFFPPFQQPAAFETGNDRELRRPESDTRLRRARPISRIIKHCDGTINWHLIGIESFSGNKKCLQLYELQTFNPVEMEGVEPSSRTGKTCAFYMLIRDSVFEPDKVPGGPAS